MDVEEINKINSSFEKYDGVNFRIIGDLLFYLELKTNYWNIDSCEPYIASVNVERVVHKIILFRFYCNRSDSYHWYKPLKCTVPDESGSCRGDSESISKYYRINKEMFSNLSKYFESYFKKYSDEFNIDEAIEKIGL